MVFRRVRLRFTRGVEVDFVDREEALRLVEKWSDRGTYPVQVVFGPEGCGKTAWLKQSVVLLRELGFEVVYVNPINKEVFAEFSIADLRSKFLTLAEEALAQNALGRLAWLAFDIAKELISATRGRIAVIVDDAFQILGVKESAIYVKALLNLIEYPPEHYERIITIAATSEGLSRWEIGRHRWAWSSPMWNMPKEGFKQLYDQIPGEKPSFEEAWRITGGNPAVLARLYEVSWDVDLVVRRLMEEKKLMPEFISRWRDLLEGGAVKDPDALWRSDVPEELINELIIRNLILYFMSDRDPRLWVDTPPPEKDLELGIGRYVAWQSPLHREAVRRALEILR